MTRIRDTSTRTFHPIVFISRSRRWPIKIISPLMNLADDQSAFLRDLVKASRQKCYPVQWIDRDGTERTTMLTAAERARLNAIAGKLGISNREALRQAAHIPVAKAAE